MQFKNMFFFVCNLGKDLKMEYSIYCSLSKVVHFLKHAI